MSVLAGTTVTFTGFWGLIRAGTSATFDLEQNGVTIPGMGSLVVTTSKTFFTPTTPASVADGDEFYLGCTAVSSSPDGLSGGLVFEVVT